jgi:hypothetical protein
MIEFRTRIRNLAEVSSGVCGIDQSASFLMILALNKAWLCSDGENCGDAGAVIGVGERDAQLGQHSGIVDAPVVARSARSGRVWVGCDELRRR